MADSTNADEPKAGIQLSGDATRQAAIKRYKKMQAESGFQSPSGGPPGMIGPPSNSKG
jgi:hypothetical protein